MPTVAGKKYSSTKSGKAQAARAQAHQVRRHEPCEEAQDRPFVKPPCEKEGPVTMAQRPDRYAIIAINVVVFLGTVTLDPRAAILVNLQYGAIPAVLFGHAELPPGFSLFPAGFGFLSIFSAMFMHGGWMHLGGNMLYLWIFGNNVEDCEHRRY